MAQVKTPDTAFRNAPADLHARLAIGAVAIVDGAAPDDELLTRLLAERVAPIPRCTQLLRTHPFHQEWTDCPEFDLTHHVHRMAVSRPGDEGELSRAIAHVLERPLELDRPPWECWVIEGLKGNRWAILMKIHHCLADGNSAAHLLTRLCDDADSDAFASCFAAQHVSSQLPVQRQNWAETLWRASSVAGTVTGALAGAIRTAVRTSPTAPVTTGRRYRAVRIPIADVDSVCRKFGVTTNDVALAAITEGFRTVLLGRGEQPRADSLRTLVPMPVRSALMSYLPVEHDDPIQRLRTVHDRRKAEQADRPQSAGIVESAINFLPTMLRSNVIQLLSRLQQRGIVTLATNVPGPRRQLRLMGQTMERLLPIPPTAVQPSTGVAVLSYGDELVFGITAEHDAAFDVKGLAAGIELGMARLVALSQDSVLLFGKARRRKRR
ncbi:wax ester/triacylglycerol synthase family O-acyltransferase [Mycobacterium sp.]|uniref:wax ester/triacylglycerol synthase family O-acyltransferase n=1 Tax=Mycobacterium sp. TaxID=1785 RepID=UPI003C72A507